MCERIKTSTTYRCLHVKEGMMPRLCGDKDKPCPWPWPESPLVNRTSTELCLSCWGHDWRCRQTEEEQHTSNGNTQGTR